MKKLAASCMLLCLLLTACVGKVKQQPEITFDEKLIEQSSETIVPDSVALYNVNISYLIPTSGNEQLQKNITNKTNMLIRSFFSDSLFTATGSLQEMVAKDMELFIKSGQDENDFTPAFEVIISSDSTYQTNSILSMRYGYYSYSGGAHGLEGVACWNFYKDTGEELSYNKLVKDEEQLLKVAEQYFRKQMEIPEDERLDENFFFEDGKFILPENFTFTATDIHFYYQPYEVAPYVYGIIELVLPYDAIAAYISYTNE